MPVRFQLVIDCQDPGLLARFWAAALGYVLEPPPEGFATWDDWRRGGDEGPRGQRVRHQLTSRAGAAGHAGDPERDGGDAGYAGEGWCCWAQREMSRRSMAAAIRSPNAS